MNMDKEKYYFSNKGAIEGPLLYKDLLNLFKNNIIKSSEYINKVGSNQWYNVDKFFGINDREVETIDTGGDWIVLSVSHLPEKRLIGPMEWSVVKEKISEGSISELDFVWKQGLSKWVPLALIENNKKVSIDIEKSEVEGSKKFDSEELIKSLFKLPLRAKAFIE